MELDVIGDDVPTENDGGQSFVGFEANRIAQRRVFEDVQAGSIREHTTIR
jgi:hypothetical protein